MSSFKGIVVIFIIGLSIGSCAVTKTNTTKSMDIYGPGVIQNPVIVDLEVNENKVSIREFGSKKEESLSLEEFIKKISEMAHQYGVQVMVDGAHAFAHIQYSIADLGCDYYAASLHKWLSVPLGAGILFVKKVGSLNKNLFFSKTNLQSIPINSSGLASILKNLQNFVFEEIIFRFSSSRTTPLFRLKTSTDSLFLDSISKS